MSFVKLYVVALSCIAWIATAVAHKNEGRISSPVTSATQPESTTQSVHTSKKSQQMVSETTRAISKQRKQKKEARKQAAQQRGLQEGRTHHITQKQHGHIYVTDKPRTEQAAREAIDKIIKQREEIEQHTAWQIKAILDAVDARQIAGLPTAILAKNVGTYRGIAMFLAQILAHPDSPKTLTRDVKTKYLPRMRKIIKIAETGASKDTEPPEVFERLKKIEALSITGDAGMTALLKDWDKERASLYFVQKLAVNEFLSLLDLVPNTYIEGKFSQIIASNKFTEVLLENMDDRYKKVFLFLNDMLTHPDLTEDARSSLTTAMVRLKRLHRTIRPVLTAKKKGRGGAHMLSLKQMTV